ncbi:MAG: YbaN family protein [Dehalococcoidia bacterium]|nr:YbaN family protein [Dehalococcoidia bacterium]
MPEKLKKGLLIFAGTTFTAIGIIGIFVPILPTTPFLLLAAACYLRSSRRLYNWLLNNRFFGAYVRNYLDGRGMPRKIKIATILLLWITIACSIIFAVQALVIRVILLVVAVGVTVHIMLIKTTPKDQNQNRVSDR